MGYELDFIGVNEETKDADAIGMRWDKGNQNYVVGVYDGGLKVYGEALREHMERYYWDSTEEKVIDFVICSHSDQDHTSGVKEILENFTVKALYMNRPWLYVNDVFDKVNDGRITPESLVRRLKEKYPYISDLEDIATKKSIPIYETFQGKSINNRLTVLSPAKEFYLELLVESEKTPLEEASSFKNIIKRSFEQILNALFESWSDEKLREDVTTSAENEMSVVILGKMDEENFLLTGDAGLRALNNAIKFADSIDISIKDDVNFYQIPHHGGRHNVSPSLLNNMIGEIVSEGVTVGKVAMVSAAKNSDHPLQMVINAFVRRGVQVFKTDGNIISQHKNMADREGWTSIDKLGFNSYVEEWE